MAINDVPITTGSGVNIAADLVGTREFQVVKIMQAADGNTAALGTSFAVSGTASVIQSGAWNIGTVTTLLGTVAVSGGGGGAQYTVDSTALGATGTGTLILGMQSGATTARGLVVTTSGRALITGTIDASQLGTWNIATVSALLGTASIIGTVNASLITTTATIPVIGTVHASRFNAFIIATTSAAAGVIIKTSGAHTLYITDVLVSVAGPMNVQLCSETTAMGVAYLAANGGFQANYIQPLVCTTAQSFRVILSSSGSCGVMLQGYTVT